MLGEPLIQELECDELEFEIQKYSNSLADDFSTLLKGKISELKREDIKEMGKKAIEIKNLFSEFLKAENKYD